MYEAVSASSISVVYASVSGFEERKQKYWISDDYLYIVEVYWSNKRTTFVKRNYADFAKLQKELTNYFQVKYDSGVIKTPVYIPQVAGPKFFQKNTRELAEIRELQLHQYLKELLQGNPLISSNKLVLDFFKSRETDPTPCQSDEQERVMVDDDHSFEPDAEEEEDDVIFNR